MINYLNPDEIREELLRLLISFDKFCSDYGLRYSLDSGTLLGAIRHKGFIPWDDDVDISMSRPDYERLRSHRKELPDGLLLLDCRDGECPTAFPKICTETVRAQEPSLDGQFDEMLWIDIFPMDGVDGDERSLERMKSKCVRAVRNYSWTRIRHLDANPIKRLFKSAVATCIGPRRAVDELNRLNDAVSESPGYLQSEWVSCLIGGDKKAWKLPKSEYENMVLVEFEGYELPAMGCWHEFLTMLYGDYMQLPPESERQTHHLKAWRV